MAILTYVENISALLPVCPVGESGRLSELSFSQDFFRIIVYYHFLLFHPYISDLFQSRFS